MPVTTGPVTQLQVDNPAGTATNLAWANPANYIDANDTSYADTTCTVAAGVSQVMRSYSAGLLAESGGAILAGATIVSVTVTASVYVDMLAALVTDTGTSFTNYNTTKDGSVVASGSISCLKNASTGPTTVTMSFPGTVGAPQTTFDRLDFGVSTAISDGIAVGVGGSRSGVVSTTSVHRSAFAKVQVVWYVEVLKAGGSTGSHFSGGGKKVEVKKTGGVQAPMASGAAKKVEKTATGGLLSPRFSGTAKKVEKTETGGARADQAFFGAGKKVEKTATGGPLVPFFSGTAKKVEKVGTGGLISPRVSGTAKNVVVIKAGGALSIERFGGPSKPAVVKAGGARSDQAFFGTVKKVEKTATGGPLIPENGNMSAYGLFTNAIGGTVRDPNGTAIVGAACKVFRQDTDVKMGTSTSAADGSYAVVVPSTATLNVTYWVYTRKAGTPDTFGVTDDDLLPTEARVQGHD